jgi:hypothetical protein
MFKCIATCDAFHRNHQQSYQCRARCYLSGLPCLRGCVSLKQALGWSLPAVSTNPTAANTEQDD